jgi:rubrerythrin
MEQKIDLSRLLRYALQMEETGRDFFMEHSKKFSHGAVVETFERLASEEAKHIDFIQALIDRVEKGREVLSNPKPGMGSSDFFSRQAGSERLDQAVLESMIPACTVLRMAYLIERDFVEFYQRFAQEAEGEIREALLMLAEWERQHEEFFKATHDRLFDQYVHMPWGG